MFELAVEDRAEAGLIDLPVNADGMALAGNLNQPGWDAELLRDDDVVGLVQMKATDSVGYVQRHLERYPDIDHVIVTSEVAETATARGLDVIDGGVENADLVAALQDSVESLDATSLVREWIPVTGLSMAAIRAVLAYRNGAPWDEVKHVLLEEGITLAAAHAVGLVVENATGLVFLRPVASVAVRMGRQRWRTQADARAALARQRALASALVERGRKVGAAAAL
jgi:hypothetical protein